jgi:glutaminyl-peptide cyclotransferase
MQYNVFTNVISVRKQYLSLLIFSFVIAGCSGDDTEPENGHIIHPEPELKIVSPTAEQGFTIGKPLAVEISIKDASKVKNVQVFVADTLYVSNLESKNQVVNIQTKNSTTGFVNIRVSYIDENGEEHSDSRTVVLYSDIVPEQKKATKVTALPHLKTSYTQGLEFYKGRLYEGTGQFGQSILAAVDLQTGKHDKAHEVDGAYFGEGITILNDTIYQLTWREHTCFVYDMNFNPLFEHSFTGEGWGLCNDGKSIIMTNGTHEVVWRNPRTFKIEKKIDVFDDQQSYEQLNEIELINGRLFANVYGENYIVEIDTATGKVLTKIDCSAIEKEGRVIGADVLNGIAHNPITRKTYLTGKWWPKLFEVIFE